MKRGVLFTGVVEVLVVVLWPSQHPMKKTANSAIEKTSKTKLDFMTRLFVTRDSV